MWRAVTSPVIRTVFRESTMLVRPAGSFFWRREYWSHFRLTSHFQEQNLQFYNVGRLGLRRFRSDDRMGTEHYAATCKSYNSAHSALRNYKLSVFQASMSYLETEIVVVACLFKGTAACR